MAALGEVPELLPARIRFGVELGGALMFALLLREGGAGGAEGVLVEGRPRLDSVGESCGDEDRQPQVELR